MTDARLEKELREIRELLYALFPAFIGSDYKLVDAAIQKGRDVEYMRRWMGAGYPFWENSPGIPGRVQELLRAHGCPGLSSPTLRAAECMVNMLERNAGGTRESRPLEVVR